MNFIGDGYGYGYGCRACGGDYSGRKNGNICGASTPTPPHELNGNKMRKKLKIKIKIK